MERRRRPGEWPVVGRMRLAIETLGRYPRLLLNILGGYYNRLQAQGAWLFLSTLAFVGIVLIALAQLGFSGWWSSEWGVVVVVFLVLLLRWLAQARGRVVVESFVDFTKEDAKAVSGLSTLLVTELGRLRELYRQIDDLSIPTTVGVESHGGFGRGKEAGVFLTVSADDATSVLEDAVASDAGIGIGGAKISLKPILTFLNRVTRGPRVVGSVHLTEAGGGPTLTAQLIGRGQCMTWRIEQEREPESPEQRKAFLDTMVHELACQMFSQLTLQGSVRPRAVEAFNEYMQLYDKARRTPRDRAHLLKEAQGELLKAVAEDERFDLAYYNLGVIYMQLAHTERVAELQSDDATSRAKFDRSELDAARALAARVALERALSRNPDRWEAYYALGVIEFSDIRPEIKLEDRLEEDDGRRDKLRMVVSYCDQALAVAPNRSANLAAIYDLRGMARTRLADEGARSDHRKAAYHSWIEYCHARRRGVARPEGMPDLVAQARANGAAALHNLALAHERRIMLARPKQIDKPSIGERLRFVPVHHNFRRAIRLAGDGSAVTAASRFERGCAYERARQPARAEKQYRLAARIQTRNAEYHARLAMALARRWRRQKGLSLKTTAGNFAELALNLLAQPFSVAVSTPFERSPVALRCRATLQALREAYEDLGSGQAEEIAEIQLLQLRLEHILSVRSRLTGRRRQPERPGARARQLEELRNRLPIMTGSSLTRTWRLDQVELAMGRLHADARNWEEARGIFEGLVERLTREERPKRIVEFSVYAHLARALREGRERRYVNALDLAAEGIRRAPLDVEARREAGRAHFALRQFSDALDAWKHALWISPSDPYLHYELAMCHRELARDQTDEEKRQQELVCAKAHFEKAQELFDGEDLDGEAWTRLWRGKIALEGGDPMEALEYLKGAEHGTARTAAALLLGEAHLLLEQRPAADHAFQRCEEALAGRVNRRRLAQTTKSALPGRKTIDALWGDELPEVAVRARIARGRAEAQFLAPGDWQSPAKAAKARERLEQATGDARTLDRRRPDEADARDEVETRVLETEYRIHQGRGEIDRALELVRERLRYKKTEEAQRLEAELLELRATNGKTIPPDAARRLAAKRLKRSLRHDGRVPLGKN